jgi:uncharacterized protein YraI
MDPTTALRTATAAVCVMAHALATAYPAQAVGDVHLRAGPARDFPVVRTLASGTTVEVLGCESDYQWCDVDAKGPRGWVYARYLEALYGDRPVIVAQQGATLGLPILSFVIGVYWASHYRDRYWYERHHQWHQWHYWPRPPRLPQQRPPPRPQPRGNPN